MSHVCCPPKCLTPDVELDPEQLDAQQHALEAAAAELHAAQTTPRYWTDFLQAGCRVFGGALGGGV